MACARKLREGQGQATVELAVVLPAVIIVAVIVVNALSFFGTCASFDRVARQTICAYAAAPAVAGDAAGSADVAHAVEAELQRAFGASNVEVSVTVGGTSLGFQRYTACIEYAPTLFGLGLRDEVFGVTLPRLSHEAHMTVDAYRPGVLL